MPFHFISLADQGFYKGFDALRDFRNTAMGMYDKYKSGGTEEERRKRLEMDKEKTAADIAYKQGSLGLDNQRLGLETAKLKAEYGGHAADNAFLTDVATIDPAGVTPPGAPTAPKAPTAPAVGLDPSMNLFAGAENDPTTGEKLIPDVQVTPPAGAGPVLTPSSPGLPPARPTPPRVMGSRNVEPPLPVGDDLQVTPPGGTPATPQLMPAPVNPAATENPLQQAATDALHKEGWTPESVSRFKQAATTAPAEVANVAKAINTKADWRGKGFLEIPYEARQSYIAAVRRAELANPNPKRRAMTIKDIADTYDAQFKLEPDRTQTSAEETAAAAGIDPTGKTREQLLAEVATTKAGLPTQSAQETGATAGVDPTGKTRDQILADVAKVKSGKAVVNAEAVQAAIDAAKTGDRSKLAGLSKDDFSRAQDILSYNAKEREALQGKDLTDESLKQWRAFNQADRDVSKLGTMFTKAGSIGPIVGALRSKNPYDVQAQQINNALTAMVPNLARGVFGEVGVLTNEDVRRYQSLLPNLRAPEDLVPVLIKDLQSRLTSEKRSWFDTNKAAGRNMSGFESFFKDGAPGSSDVVRATLAPDTDGRVLVTSPEQMASLPPGTKIKDAKGNTGVVPAKK